MKTYTARPWKTNLNVEDITYCEAGFRYVPVLGLRNGKYHIIANVQVDEDDGEQAANLRIIEAAPDAIDALRDIVMSWEGGDLAAAVRKGAAVIERVEGRMKLYRVNYTRTIEYYGVEDIEAESLEQAAMFFNDGGRNQPENWADGTDVSLRVNEITQMEKAP